MCTCDCPNIVIYRRIMNACTVDRFSDFSHSPQMPCRLALHDDIVLYLAYLPWMPERGNKLPRACGW